MSRKDQPIFKKQIFLYFADHSSIPVTATEPPGTGAESSKGTETAPLVTVSQTPEITITKSTTASTVTGEGKNRHCPYEIQIATHMR